MTNMQIILNQKNNLKHKTIMITKVQMMILLRIYHNKYKLVLKNIIRKRKKKFLLMILLKPKFNI